MRAAIYNPYLDTLGGGERYTMTVAHALVKKGWDVEVQWPSSKILEWLELRLGLDLSDVEIVPDVSRGAGYDLLFWLSDGSIPLMLAKKNILHFQTPFQNVRGRSLFNKLKLAKTNKVICNSQFTKSFIDKEYGVESEVVYPPVAVGEIKPLKKENVILFVGRFSKLQQSKGQDVLVQVFKKMCDDGLKGWKLVLGGGSEIGGGEFVNELKKMAEGYPVNILENVPFSEIKKLYGTSKIFWSASGFEKDEKSEPEKVEHFGITTVEAMAAGCVPIVYKAGGHKEVIENREHGFLWQTTSELQHLTLGIVKDERGREKIGDAAQKRSRYFSQQNFEKEILRLIS